MNCDLRTARRFQPSFGALCAWAALHLAFLSAAAAGGAEKRAIADKTLVVWAAPADLTQRGGSALTLENPGGEFDAIVFGELEPGKWMAGSDFFRRTWKDQERWPAEAAGGGAPVQIAIAYRGKEVSIYRNGRPYAGYTLGVAPAAFSTESIVLMGLRHLDAGGPRNFYGAIEDARIYEGALEASALAALKPNEPSEPRPLAWWSFESGRAEDLMKTFPNGRLVGAAKIEGGLLQLNGGWLAIGVEPARSREAEDWPVYHISALPEEGLCRPYDANGCIYWKGKYHVMVIFQDPARGHSWGHLSSWDLVNWTHHPPALVPRPGDPDQGIFSGNAFVNKEGVPMLCWFGIDAGVCVAAAEDDELIRWKKHPRNPIIPIPKPGEPEHGLYRVWDPYLWLEGDTYYCLLGGNQLPNGKDTLFLLKSPDLVSWKPLGTFYSADPSWTVEGEDCSCPDFFQLGGKHVLLCISHKVGARCYIGRYEKEKFHPERHVRMNWPGGNFFAPESLLDAKGRRIVWAWVTDPRLITTQQATGSGVQSLPRVLSLAEDGTLRLEPAEELAALRRGHRRLESIALPADADAPLEGIRGDCLEIAAEIDSGEARAVGIKVRCSPDGKEETGIWYDAASKTLKIDMSRSTLRTDVAYCEGPLDTGGLRRASDNKNPRLTVEAPFDLAGGEMLRLRLFLDKPMLEVFANGRQCIVQQIFPAGKDSLLVKGCARGGRALVRSIDAWEMAPARFVNEKAGPAGKEKVLFEDRFEGKLGEGWTWLRENPPYWRLRDSALEIHVEPGLADTVKNALLRPAPDRRRGKFAIEATITSLSKPTQQYEQAGITWYTGGKPVFKFVKELVDGQTMMIPGRKPMASETVQLRLVVSADGFTAQYRPDGKGEFQTAASGPLPAPGDDQVSLQCYHGPTGAEHWIRFDDFRIAPLAE
ncbi:MAG: GH32 C-terminal domain-containing protein [Planctomycetes bacterium]|nr:GH32 C-terminal domain-containing protein [Planctomycetota bacterium]